MPSSGLWTASGSAFQVGEDGDCSRFLKITPAASLMIVSTEFEDEAGEAGLTSGAGS